MSKVFVLVLGLTYATVNSVFRAGETYTAEQVASVKDDTDDAGTPYFNEVDLEEDAAAPTPNTRRTIAVGRSGKKSASPQQETSAEESQAETTGGDDTVLTV